MRFSLAALSRRVRNSRRRAILIRDIIPPATLATNLYRAAYAPIIELWTRRTDAIVAEYARTLAALITDSPADLQAQLDAADNDFDRLFILLNAALSDWSAQTERWARSKWAAAVLSASGVDISTLIGPEDTRATLGTYLEWNVALIKDVNAEAKKRFAASIFSALHERKPAAELARDLRENVAMSRRRAMGIASDQLSKVTSALADERRRQAGIDVWKWRHSGKLHPRSWHKQRDGNLYGEDEMVGREVDGKTVAAAPEPNDLPGRPPYCGCRSQAVLILD